jgi:hypothetical protein
VTSRRPLPRQVRRSRGGPTPRDQVLARRRMALIALGLAVPITLALALYTGSTIFLIVNLLVDILLAGYIAMLLQIKQTQQHAPAPYRGPSSEEEEEVRVVR